MKYLLRAFLILMALSQTVSADDLSRVKDTLESKLDTVIGILGREDLDTRTRQDRVAEILEPLFDFALMSKLALGKEYWFTLSEENKNRFTRIFTERLKESYLSKIDLYTNEKITFETPLRTNNKIYIPTTLITKSEKISILYKFYQSEHDWKIYDVEIEGVSFIRTYRSQFIESLQSGTIEELLTKLEKMGSVQ